MVTLRDVEEMDRPEWDGLWAQYLKKILPLG